MNQGKTNTEIINGYLGNNVNTRRRSLSSQGGEWDWQGDWGSEANCELSLMRLAWAYKALWLFLALPSISWLIPCSSSWLFLGLLGSHGSSCLLLALPGSWLLLASPGSS
jgi:hypothetical protein